MSGPLGHHGVLMTGAQAPKSRWRILITATGESPHIPVVGEVEMRASPGGANLAVGGTASASSVYPGGSASWAFNGNGGVTAWAAANTSLPQWLAYQFSAPVSINQLAITAQNDARWAYQQSPRTFTVQSSVDGSTWINEWVVDAGAFTAGQTKVFTRP